MGDVLFIHNLPWGPAMRRGSIRSRQRCGVCGEKGKYHAKDWGGGRRALVCTACGQYATDKPEIRIRFQDVRYTIRRDQDGREFDADLVRAEAALDLIRRQIENNAFFPQDWTGPRWDALLWDTYLKGYLESEKTRLLPDQAATYQKKKSMKAYFEGAFPGLSLREIRNHHVMDFVNGRALKHLSPKTRADLAAELRYIFRRAVLREEIERAPLVPSVQVPEKVIDWIGPEAQEAALKAVPLEHRPIIAFMFTYGPRPAEACALCWDQIDREKACFYLARTFSRRKLKDKPKTKRPNILPIGKELAAYLDAVPKGIGRTPVFKNPTAHTTKNPAGFYTPDAINKIWSEACQSADVPPIKLYNATRHSRGMQALNLDGWGLADVARLFGHTSEKHTRRYAQVDVSRLRKLIDKENVVSLAGVKESVTPE